MLLYIPGVYGNIRSYKELFALTAFEPREKFTVPTTVLQCGGTRHYEELSAFNFAPREWVERSADVRFFRRYDEGGHFPAMSVPEVVVRDIREALG